MATETCAKCGGPVFKQESWSQMFPGMRDSISYYECLVCGDRFCDQCLTTLPLTGSPGYAMCPKDRVQLQKRAIDM